MRSSSCGGSPANSSTPASSRSSSSCSRAKTSPSSTARPPTSRRSSHWRRGSKRPPAPATAKRPSRSPASAAEGYRCARMRAVTFQAPEQVRIEEKPDPDVRAADDALVRVEASGICGSDLHIYHGRVPVEVGFTIGHEFVGTVLAAGEGVERVAVGDRVLGTFHTACATCGSCLRGDYHRCRNGQTFGHGAHLGDLQGAQAERLLVPRANLTLRRVPEGMSDEVALFAGDVMGTGYHAVAHAGMRSGDTVAVLGLGPVGLCAVQAALAGGATRVFAIDSVQERLQMAASFGATPLHLEEQEPKQAIRAATDGLGADVVVDAVGDPGP